MNEALIWLVPPVMGAIIGYVTNDIAIKMLFRPLTEKRLWKFRIPFTPGILPRQRHKLADNIGRMVAKELLTEAIVRNRLQSIDFRQTATRTTADITERVLSLSLVDITTIFRKMKNTMDETSIPSDNGDSLNDAVGLASVIWDRINRSDIIKTLLADSLEKLLRSLGERTLDSLLDRDAELALMPFITKIMERIIRYVEEGSLEAKLHRYLEIVFEERKSLAEILPGSVDKLLALIPISIYPTLSEIVLSLLHMKTIRNQIESQGRLFLKNVLLKLNVFQRFFLSAAQYDKTLTDRMPEIIDDLVEKITETLKAQETPIAFAEAFQQTSKQFLALTPAEACSRLGTNADSVATSLNGLAVWLVSDRKRLSDLTGFFGESLHQEMTRPIRVIIEERFGLPYDSMIRRIGQSIPIWLAERNGTALFLGDLYKKLGKKPISELIDLAEVEKTRLDNLLTDNALMLIDRNIGSMLSGLDVKKIVTDRIDHLDMLSVERLVLDVLADQLRWINVFGAILGALIGLIQVSLTKLLS